ncbi:DNA ligase D [Rhizobium sp. KVB221]|uniref:DNA ligase (ATP) n=1 Tax=Rhizobium setariae TaxID=2801340 RepID=A0A937CNF1_9HYPH|nr:DNA ligase D [Rhizobium setariae]MBL0375425.1 DNA ligase D [Rhizobium setariae]
MALDVYHAKRDFSRTREPRGRVAVRKKGHDSFVIQQHAATRLHYDFRLEMGGVLKSWAVTRGPSLVPGERRLAVHVEDHPLEYGGFEGTIPKGEYGGGEVIVWDRGTWTPVGDLEKGYKKGHLEFELHGEKLRGRWHLVRMQTKPREKHENWLLIKADDEEARSEDEPDILDERPESVLSGRTIKDLKGEDPGWSSKKGGPIGMSGRKAVQRAKGKALQAPYTDISSHKMARRAALPEFVEPQLATLADKPPMGERWIHEIKFDGYRLQARIAKGRATLRTRNGLDWTKRFGKVLTDALAALPVKDALIDGELVVENSAGSSDFSTLQADLSVGRNDRFVYYGFDILHLDGNDLRNVALLERKRVLRGLLRGGSNLRFSEHYDDPGPVVFEHACRLSLEGIISKLAEAPYRHGRSKDWLKSKCSARQEFVIAGYVPSSATANSIGSLVMGVFEKGELQHVGRVGTGYSADMARALFRTLQALRTDESPFDEKLKGVAARDVAYVRPELVAEVEFAAWTADGKLRHAAFRGLREDKVAKDIKRESALSGGTAKPEVGKVKLTHPDRIYWPDAGVTKEGLADYYAEVWPKIAPFVAGRPLALLRAPEGIDGQTFFQKHGWKGMSKEIKLLQDPSDPTDELIVIEDLDGLLALVQSAALEIHPWGVTTKNLEKPDMIIMDLDPGEGVSWAQIINAAYEVRRRLEAAGLPVFVKTSGGKGLHVVTPLKPSAGWEAVKAFAKGIADDMAEDEPDRYVSTITKSKRKGKILVDYLRNGRGATAVAAYSSRARKGAPVSMPLDWDELSGAIGPAYFTVLNATQRLAALANDPWETFRSSEKPLPKNTGR